LLLLVIILIRGFEGIGFIVRSLQKWCLWGDLCDSIDFPGQTEDFLFDRQALILMVLIGGDLGHSSSFCLVDAVELEH